ncbi:hypothetical protein IQ07DRAFT_634766 [Pyrenochaeta sp. DS3sAY3a]|nr:hypothetical protein IQ07DRAFT_634766 [Pyrenochaeta sp. DS3sAY3a]
MGVWTVQKIEVDAEALYPAVDERGCAPNFRPSSTTLFEKEKPVVHVINVLAIDGGFDLFVSFDGIGVDSSLGDQHKWSAVTISAKIPGASTSFFLCESRKLSYQPTGDTTASISCKFENVSLKTAVSPLRGRTEPWAFVADLDFDINLDPLTTGDDSTTLNLPKSASIELYAICPVLPKFLRYEGIPVSLLRFALSPTNIRSRGDENEPYLEAITKRVFNSGFIYERKFGQYMYTSGAGRRFEIGKFLRIWNVLNKTAPESSQQLFDLRFKKTPPKVNCMDQAGILGLCMSFGCADETDHEKLILYFMSPFGFLHDTPLVGFGPDKCNNPLTTFGPALWVEPTSKYRTYFGKHVFLMFRDLIYDACAGPVLGMPLTKYVKEGIDQEPGTYPEEFRFEKKWQSPPKKDFTGQWSNAKPYPVNDEHGGIMGELENLISSDSDFNQPPPDLNLQLNDTDFYLDIPKLVSTLIEQTKGSDVQVDLEEDCKMDTGCDMIRKDDTRQGEVTWCIKVNDLPITMSLRAFESFAKAATERYAMYDYGNIKGEPHDKKQASLGRDLVVHEKRESTLPGGAVVDSYHATALAGRFLIDCHSTELEDESLFKLLTKVMDLAVKTTPRVMTVSNPEADGGPEGEDPDKYHMVLMTVGETMEYKIHTENCLDIDWTYTNGSVFLLDYKKENEDGGTADSRKHVYTFTFLAKRAGGDVVKLSFYDASYTWAKSRWRFLNFRIKTAS